MRFALAPGVERWWSSSGTRAAGLLLALFVFAGYYKAADVLRLAPVDLTLFFGGLTAGFCLLALWKERCLPPGLLPMLLVFASLGLGLHWPQAFDTYAAQKEMRLFSLTALAAFAPLVLLRDVDARLTFLSAIAVLGLVMAGVAVVEVAASGQLSRTGVFNTNPILLARASGFAALFLCVAYWLGRLRLWLFLPAVMVALLGLLASASRGPLVALLATAVFLAALGMPSRELRARILATLIVGATALAGTLFFMDEAGGAARRILRIFTGEWGDTEISRWQLWGQALQVIADSPLGIGWGRFSEHVQVYNDGVLLIYPHNVFLELAAESGWISVAAFTVLVGFVLVAGTRGAFTAVGGPTTTLVVVGAVSYWLGCALFSGDVNDNRTLWAMIAMALAARADRRGTADGGDAGG